MDIVIEPHPLAGSLHARASKSMAHRLLILAALSEATCDVYCDSTSEDIEATVSCLGGLGAQVAHTKNGFRVCPLPRELRGAPPRTRENPLLDCGESGSTLRFILPIACALGCGAHLTGAGRLAERPLSPLYEQLESHGARLSERGRFPLVAEGRISAGEYFLPGNVSSQFVSGLLMAATLMEGTSRVVVSEPVESASYISLTIHALALFGCEVREGSTRVGTTKCRVFELEGAPLASHGPIRVEGDWSNAAFWLVSGAIGQPVSVEGLDLASAQGDRAILAAIALLGGQVRRRHDCATTLHGTLAGRTLDVSNIPDLVPPIAALAAFSQGETRIRGAARLRLKESDRLESVARALRALGCPVSVLGDGLSISGGRPLTGGAVDTANDHRIAMMAAICAAHAAGPSLIHGAQCVNKSYPGFFDDFRSLGGIAYESE